MDGVSILRPETVPLILLMISNFSSRFTSSPIQTMKVESQYLFCLMREQKIVSNESADILRMLASAFNEFCPTPEAKALDLYPPALREKIDELNEWIYK